MSAVRKLQQRKEREARHEFLVEGPQGVAEALERPGVVRQLFVTEEALAAHPRWAPVTTATVVSPAVLAAMAETRNPQGVVAVCGFLDVELTTAVPPATGKSLVALLWQIRDPGNAGTVLRTADAAGADAVLLSSESVDLYNGKVVRSTAGSLFHVPAVREVDPVAAIEHLRAAGYSVLAADGAGEAALYDLLPSKGAPGSLSGAVAWVFGNEARGLDPEIAGRCDARVAIPHPGPAESLNLASAAAVCLMTTAAAQAGLIARQHVGAGGG